MGDRPSSRRTFVTTAVAGATGAFVPRSAGGMGPSDMGFLEDAQVSRLTGLSLMEASELLRARKVSPVELTEACLRRIEALNPRLNAFITVTAEQALAQAREAEADLQRGRAKGPLHGIPLALKDLVDTAGVRTTAASALFKDRVPTHDAEVVRRLRAAGAVLLGKLNMHELAYGGSSVISYFGPVPNPWAPDYSSGGSSSGSAVAVAAGLCYGALGSDTGGSIRQPAAYCGIVGLKPTYGRVSTRGVVPLSWSLDHVGPMTRTVRDAALLLQVMAGYDPEDTASTDVSVEDYAEAFAVKTSSLRIGIARAHFYEGLHPEVQEAMDSALTVLRQLTSSPREVETPPASDPTVLRAEAYSYHRESAVRTPALFQPETLRRIRGGAEIDTAAYVNARRQLDQLRRSAPGIFNTVDLLITPTTPVPPFLISELLANPDDLRAKEIITLRHTRPFNMLGLPTISVPCGFTRAGLPIGMQITGPPWGEKTVLRLANAYEEATDWHTRRPALDS
jgi:aspartyl-tRNA(Asn)/glutamyl-tRNA(Gln) amidotransferase subunit A